MAFPLDNTLVNPTGRYGPRRSWQLPNGQYTASFHGGDDLAPEVQGTQLLAYAVGQATVHSYGRKADAGLYVILRLRDNSLWRYCHLSSIASSVVEAKKSGKKLADGAIIGRIGSTGNSTGVHLHLERYPNGQLNVRSDPRPYYWGEWNPAKGKPAVPTKPAAKPVKPAPKPKPAPGRKPPRINGNVRLTSRWYGYVYNNLTYKQRNLLPAGTYRIVGIVNGNLRLRGNGRDAWVDASAAKYVV